jgi:hypothetical protein
VASAGARLVSHAPLRYAPLAPLAPGLLFANYLGAVRRHRRGESVQWRDRAVPVTSR